jgi:hypothetical protein
MKKSDLENFYFYNNRDGSEDIIAISLNCFEASIYNVVKNSYKLPKDILLPLCLKEIYPSFSYNEATGVFRLLNLNQRVIPIWSKYIKINKVVRKRDSQSIKFLEDLLDKGQMVMVQTAFANVRFLKWWDPNYDLNTFLEGEGHHIMIVVYHEGDKIYYAEKVPELINKDYFVPYELNEQIGVAFKSEIEDASNYFLRCYTLDVNIDSINETKSFKKQINDYMHNLAASYSPCTESVDGTTNYYGIEAYRKFAEFCDEGRDLKDYFITMGWSITERVAYDIWMVYGSRTILKEYINSIKSDNTENYHWQKPLIETLRKDIIEWKRLEKLVVKLTSSGCQRLNNEISNQIHNIISMEDKMNILLKEFCI